MHCMLGQFFLFGTARKLLSDPMKVSHLVALQAYKSRSKATKGAIQDGAQGLAVTSADSSAQFDSQSQLNAKKGRILKGLYTVLQLSDSSLLEHLHVHIHF